MWTNERVPWVSRLGQCWRDGFKEKTHETLNCGMLVMLIKGPSDHLFQMGQIHRVLMKKCVDVDYYLEQDDRAIYHQRVHMHSIMVIHHGVKVTVDQNGVMFVECWEDAEIVAPKQVSSGD
jgi:hypothetical protein